MSGAKGTVVVANGYERVDGRNAFHSAIRRITLGAPVREENEAMRIAAQIWADEAGAPGLYAELPIHQVIDLAIVLGEALLHFREAYRLPLLYDPEHPEIARVGLQGAALPVAICTENEGIDDDIRDFAQALAELGEITGERLRVLGNILEELEWG
ncbi:MAG: DUF6530 family protein [Collinsella sp.]|nr:DUF6530 family protein [Collinsella sp.]